MKPLRRTVSVWVVGRPLTGGRGLKQLLARSLYHRDPSPPHGGARIETLLSDKLGTLIMSPPHGGARIETSLHAQGKARPYVAPSRGGAD